MTSDEAAEALLDFTAAAAISDFAAVVHLPAIDELGETITADLVIGPASEVIVTPCRSEFGEPDTTSAVADLRERISALGDSRHMIARPVAYLEDDSNYLDLP